MYNKYVCIKDIDMLMKYTEGSIYSIQRLNDILYAVGNYWMYDHKFFEHFRPIEEDITIKINNLLEHET